MLRERNVDPSLINQLMSCGFEVRTGHYIFDVAPNVYVTQLVSGICDL